MLLGGGWGGGGGREGRRALRVWSLLVKELTCVLEAIALLLLLSLSVIGRKEGLENVISAQKIVM